jgi:ribosome maturation factor RimP
VATGADQRAAARLKELVEGIVERHGLELVEVTYNRSGRRQLLRVYVDKVGGVTISECEAVSRRLSADLDASEMIESRYTLEVSSPGFDRPLTAPADFRRKVGRKIELRHHDDTGRERRIKGIIGRVGESSVTVGDANVNWDAVIEGKLII